LQPSWSSLTLGTTSLNAKVGGQLATTCFDEPKTMVLVIRPATENDAAALSRIHFEAVHRTAAPFYPAEVIDTWSHHPDEARAEQFRQAISGKAELFLVAERDGEVVGFGSIVPSAAELRAVYVHPDAGRAGIGAALLERLEQWAIEQGVSALRMDASVNAEAFYARHGYEILERSSHQLGRGPRMACVRMRKSLQEQRRP
jgi:putative acetyltransferase